MWGQRGVSNGLAVQVWICGWDAWGSSFLWCSERLGWELLWKHNW